MSLLFVHNIRLKRDENGNYYTHSSYSTDVWNRYLNISEDLSVITRKDPSIYEEKEAQKWFESFESNKIKNIDVIDHTSSVSAFMNPFNRYRKNNTIKKAVKSHDMVIARLPSEYGYTAIKYAKRYKKPYLVEVVACGWDSLWNYSIKGKMLAPLNFWKQRKYVKDSSYAIYVTNEFLQKRYPTKGESVGCSNVSLTEISEEILQKRISRIKNINSKITIGTTAATNVRYKGQQYIIEALGELKKQGNTNFEYQLVGGGSQEYLKSIAEKYNVADQVKFLGSMRHKDVFEWLDNIDLYAQPSRQEGLPRALIEAMSRGLPAMGAKTAGIPELLNHQYIFSNRRSNINEIISILTSIDNEKLIKEAVRNFNESKKYKKEIIEIRRNAFFKKFNKSTS